MSWRLFSRNEFLFLPSEEVARNPLCCPLASRGDAQPFPHGGERTERSQLTARDPPSTLCRLLRSPTSAAPSMLLSPLTPGTAVKFPHSVTPLPAGGGCFFLAPRVGCPELPSCAGAEHAWDELPRRDLLIRSSGI